MVREILFRGKRIDNGEWVEGHLLEQDYPCYKAHIVPYINIEQDNRHTDILEHMIYEVDPATVGEFSGKHDKIGRRIFEGDIVDGLFRFTTPLRAVCAFKDGAFGIAWTHGGVDHFSAFTSICNVEYEVVGNIYDNPEMLEVEE